MQCLDVVAMFLADRRRRGRRAATLRHYESRLRGLVREFGRREIASISREEWLDWLAEQRLFPDGVEKSPDTIRADMTVLKMLLEFARSEALLAAAPLRPGDLRRPRGRRRERIPTREEVDRILAAAPPEFARLYQTLRLTGARPSELVHADIEQIEETPHGRFLVVQRHKTSAAGGAARRIPLGSALDPYLRAAIGMRRCGPIFLDARGRRWTVARASAMFRRCRAAAGLDESIVLYSARHEFGSAVAKRLGIHQARELLGHASITTTQRYAHISDPDRLAAQQAASELLMERPNEPRDADQAIPHP